MPCRQLTPKNRPASEGMAKKKLSVTSGNPPRNELGGVKGGAFTIRQTLPAYLFILTMVVLDRARVLADFAFQYTDKDQAVYWSAAYEFMLGRFHEPRFFGQAYHHALDALLAAPLIKIAIPFHIALPVVASLVSLAPFLLLSGFSLARGYSLSALAIVSIPLILPVEYGMIASIPRGFATGVLFASLSACTLLFPGRAWLFFACAFFLGLGVFVVPNAAVAAVPLAVYCWLTHWKKPSLYFSAGAAGGGGY